jgi:hypothetical protein
MAQGDVAFLVGISNYADEMYPTLQGPINDVDLMEKWLAADGTSVTRIVTKLPWPTSCTADTTPPVPDDFETPFVQLERSRMQLDPRGRLKNRLYLYFSGHGFCGRDINQEAEAALYTANANTFRFAHIYGTYFARRAKAIGLFKEIILIMDCCRDSEINRMPVPPMLRLNPSPLPPGQYASLLMIYAVPKGAKTTEGRIAARGNRMYGYLTHAFMSAIEHARPDRASEPAQTPSLSATALRQHMLETWESVCGPDAPPRPEIYLPSQGEILFRAENVGVKVVFRFPPQPKPYTILTLRDHKLRRIGEFSATDTNEDLVRAGEPVLSWSRAGSAISLTLVAGLYGYELKSDGSLLTSSEFKAEQGALDVSL